MKNFTLSSFTAALCEHSTQSTKHNAVCILPRQIAGLCALLFAVLPFQSKALHTVDFTYTPASDICVGDSVFFTSTGDFAASYNWDFGDGDTSIATNPAHVYFTSGTFTVTLTTISFFPGDTTVATQTIIILAPPFPFFIFPPAPNPACLGESIQFDPIFSPTANSVLWTFDDGDSSTIFNVEHTYAGTGTYSVWLRGYNVCGSDSIVTFVTVDTTTPPAVFISASPNPVCPGFPVDFTVFSFLGTSPDPSYSYLWDLGDGDTSIATNPAHAYTAVDTFTALLITTNNCSSDSDSVAITVDSTLVPSVSALPVSATICPGATVYFSGSGSQLIDYLWDFDDGNVSFLQDPTNTFPDTGTYNVVFTGTNACGNSANDISVIIVDSNAAPIADFQRYPATPMVCIPIGDSGDVYFENTSTNSQTCLWDFGDGSPLDSNCNTVHRFPWIFQFPDEPDTFTVTLIATSSCGGQDTVQKDVIGFTDVPISAFYWSDPFPFFNPICPGTPVFFDNNSSDTTNSFWDFDDPLAGPDSISNDPNPVHIFADTGTHTVVLTASNGCGNSASFSRVYNVSFDAGPPNTNFSTSPSSACPAEAFDFQVSVFPLLVDTANVLWVFGDGDSSTVTNPSHAYDTSGTYTVTFIYFSACGNDTVFKELTVKSGTNPDFAFTMGCLGDTNYFTDASNPLPESWSWEFGDGDTSTQQNPWHIYAAAGTYNVTLTAVLSGCASSITQQVPISDLSVSTTVIDVSCFGSCDGSATANPAGGFPPYNYSWNTGEITQTITGLCPATYGVLVWDSIFCFASDTAVVISEPAPLLLTTGSIDATCGFPDGVAWVTVSGGTPPYSPLWNDPLSQTTDTAIGLFSGTYQVMVTDSNGCQDSATAIVNDAGAPTVTIDSVIDVGCFGDNDGIMIASATGGTLPYTYQWDDSLAQTDSIADSLAGGVYTVTVTDSNNCQASASDTVNEPLALIISITNSTNITCFGLCDGTATVTPSGGAIPYTYQWDDPLTQTDSTADTLCAGILYSVIVTDANGCADTTDIILTQPTALTSSITDSTPISCNGICDGTATVTPSGGTSPYAYLWSPSGGTDSTATGLCGGVTYSVIITDAFGCTTNSLVTLSDPVVLVSSIAGSVNASCPGVCDGEAIVSVSGGTTPYNYLWDDPSAQTNDTVVGLCAGAYQVIVTDNNGCEDSSVVSITEPVLNSGIISSTDATCNGVCDGFATASASGDNTPFTYQWDDPGSQTTTTATGLCAGTYNVVVTDSIGCTDTSTAIIGEPPLLTSGISDSTMASCGGVCDGSATVTPAGGTSPYTYAWDDPLTQSDSTAINLCAASYNVIVTDNNGCNDTSSVTITEPPALALSMSSEDATCDSVNGKAIVSVSGGSSPYTYLWDDSLGQTTDTATGLFAGVYSVVVTDAIGCSDSGSVGVNNLLAGTASISVISDVSCNGGSDGSATVSMTGGNAPFTYLWDNGETTDTAITLAVGSHSVTVTDAVGCIATDVATINQPSPMILTPSAVDANCGQADGQACVSASGGTPFYTFLWDSAAGFQTASCAANLPAGTYSVTVTDANGCVAGAAVTVGDIPGGTASISSSTNTNCNGSCDGDATAAITGGTAPFTYQWDDLASQTTVTAINLCAGSYNVIITDAVGCNDTASVTIIEPPVLISSISGSTNASCNGVCDGDAMASAVGGTAPYSFQWDDPLFQTNDTATGLCAAIYNVVVTDANGCDDTSTVTITEPPAITLTPGSTDAICGDTNGTAFISASNGVAPYTYLWDDPLSQTNDTATGLSAGTYTVLVTDSNGCTVSDIVAVNNAGAPSVSIPLFTDVSCNGGNDGEATVSATGGTPPYTYQWNDPLNQTTATATGLPAGTYTATVTDSNSCIASDIVTISEPGALLAPTTGTDESCSGSCDGEATVSVSGGITPYSYLWDDLLGQTTATATGLCATNYNVIVTDSNGCPAIGGVTISGPAALTSNITGVTNTSCGLCDGDATVSAAGGTTPYTYLWDDGQVTVTAINLCAGVYNVTVTDANGCTATSSVTVTGPGGLSSSITSSTNVSCFGACDGSATVTALGGASPYTWLWVDGQTVATAINLCAGNHSVTVTDSNGCITTSSVTLTEPPILTSFISDSTDVSCNGACDGSATVTPSGGIPPYNYLWTPSGQVDSTAIGLCAGTYIATVTDLNGCTDTANVLITEPAVIVVNTAFVTNVSVNGGGDGAIDINVTGGTGPYTYLWSPGNDTTQDISGLGADTFMVTVTDSNGCQGALSVIVTEPPLGITEFDLNITFEIYPNPSTGVFTFEIQLYEANDIKIEIYNVLGETVFTKLFSDIKNITQEVDLGSLAVGMYTVKLFTTDKVINRSITIAK
ncbi:MAG: PKD domain-containing protein [Cytophagales bacterium]|nr:PKD domain-containing protein [Cytophagales bacterium]